MIIKTYECGEADIEVYRNLYVIEKEIFGGDAWNWEELYARLHTSDTLIELIEDDTTVGYAAVDKNKYSYQIWSIGILPEHRRKGFGASMLQAIIDLCPEETLELMVREDNLQAISLYEKFRFVPWKLEHNVYFDGCGALTMRREPSI